MVLAHRSLLITAGVGDGALIALGVKIPVRPRASIDSGSGFGTASVLEAITSQSIPRGRTVWGWEVRGKRGKKRERKRIAITERTQTGKISHFQADFDI